MTPKELLKTKYVGSDENGNLLLAYSDEQISNIKKALTRLEELEKKETEEVKIETIFGFDINEVRLVCALIQQKFASKDNFHEVLRKFTNAYNKGFNDCDDMYKKLLDEQFKKILE